jgi:hypothetical protein
VIGHARSHLGAQHPFLAPQFYREDFEDCGLRVDRIFGCAHAGDPFSLSVARRTCTAPCKVASSGGSLAPQEFFSVLAYFDIGSPRPCVLFGQFWPRPPKVRERMPTAFQHGVVILAFTAPTARGVANLLAEFLGRGFARENKGVEDSAAGFARGPGAQDFAARKDASLSECVCGRPFSSSFTEETSLDNSNTASYSVVESILSQVAVKRQLKNMQGPQASRVSVRQRPLAANPRPLADWRARLAACLSVSGAGGADADRPRLRPFQEQQRRLDNRVRLPKNHSPATHESRGAPPRGETPTPAPTSRSSGRQYSICTYMCQASFLATYCRDEVKCGRVVCMKEVVCCSTYSLAQRLKNPE